MPRVIQVIEHHDIRGTGGLGDPWRDVIQYLDFNGNVLAEQRDEYPQTLALERPIVVTTDFQRGSPCS